MSLWKCVFIVSIGTEFTGDMRLALDAQPVHESPALSDSLDVTAEPTAAAAADRQSSSAADIIPPAATAVSVSDQSLVGLRLDLSKPSAAGGTDGPR